MTPEPATYPSYRFPAEIISYAVWLYHVFGCRTPRCLARSEAQNQSLPEQQSGELAPATRRRERQMQRFKSPGQAQRFLSSHTMIYGHFRPWRHLMTTAQYRRARAEASRVWPQETCV